MSHTILPDACINCGACEFCCPTEAIHPPDLTASQPAVFWIETYRCNDCRACIIVCTADCILPDPDTVAWCDLVKKFGKLFKRAAGTPASLSSEAARRGQNYLQAPGVGYLSPASS